MLSSENVPATPERRLADIGGDRAGVLKTGDCLSLGAWWTPLLGESVRSADELPDDPGPKRSSDVCWC
jgi:hypothetical protein